IRPSKSPASSALFFVPKKEGDLRTCIDYRALNQITVKNRYPLPLIPELLDQVKDARIYTKLDLRGAYHLVRIKEGDEWKTAFRTKYGLFEYQVMPFGLCNAPAAFQYFMNDVLRELIDVCVVVYIDDILVYSSSEEEHQRHVKEVLERLRQHNLFAKLEKCVFNATEVEFLGFILSPNGVHMDSKKVDEIIKWPSPTSVKGVQSMLGFANFYRRFIPEFSRIVQPITALLKKNKRFEWSSEAEQAFQDLKAKFISAPVLKHPRPELPYIMETDASSLAMGAVLSQRDSVTNQLHLAQTNIQYHSKDWLHQIASRARNKQNITTDKQNITTDKLMPLLLPVLSCSSKTLDPTELVDPYNTTITQALDTIAPLKLWKSKPKAHLNTCFTPQLKALRTEKRKLEATWKYLPTKENKDNVNEISSKYKAEILRTKCETYNDRIQKASSSTKELFVMLREKESPIPPDDSCPKDKTWCRNIQNELSNKIATAEVPKKYCLLVILTVPRCYNVSWNWNCELCLYFVRTCGGRPCLLHGHLPDFPFIEGTSSFWSSSPPGCDVLSTAYFNPIDHLPQKYRKSTVCWLS
ncbi:uncharacterized protein, partial [Ambystoma mexicanum]|uniref:uncharacterized protein n=1 Tax=Ambystoma mexicanum TaxID=8296 RepID=UPI0037E7FB85